MFLFPLLLWGRRRRINSVHRHGSAQYFSHFSLGQIVVGTRDTKGQNTLKWTVGSPKGTQEHEISKGTA